MNIKTISLAAVLASVSTTLAAQGGDILTLDETAAWLKVPTAEVQTLAERNELPGRRLGAAGWRFDKEVLVKWLAGTQNAEPNTVERKPPTSVGLGAGAPGLDDSEGAEPVKTRASGMESRSSFPTAEETALRDVSLLGKSGSYSVDAKLAYTFSDAGSRGLAVLGGRAETDMTIASIGLSYRLNESTQIFTSLPYVTQRSTVEDLVSGEIARSTTQGFQALGLGIRRILQPEAVGVPQITGTIDAAVPLQFGLRKRLGVELSVMKSLDPVTVFATVRAERALGDGSSDSGNRMMASFGYVYALNDSLAVSTSMNASVEDAIDSTGLGWRRTKRFELKLGMPTSFGRSGFFLEPYVSFGLNQSNSSATVGVSLVKTFAP